MSALAMTTIEPALVAAFFESLPLLRALNVPKSNDAMRRPFASLGNVMKMLRLLFTALILCREMGCVRAVRRILWIMRASMTLSGFCYH